MSEPHDSDLPYDDSIYRIYINPHTNVTELSCIGIEVDRTHWHPGKAEYTSADDLPMWMQEKIALLMMTPLDKPTVAIEGVGKRIDANVYWVFRDPVDVPWLADYIT